MPYVLVEYTDSKLTVHDDTFDRTSEGCWGKAFNVVADRLGPEWRDRYWKRWDASKKAANRKGFTVERCRIVF